ncbi:MAG: sigma-E factor negative regulatory protein [Pseudomonadales bacterium]|nr:sigma-E factor negative regulatory protein [Pseudomonadales bacterium]
MSLENSRGRPLEESLSALMDNEADDLELRRLLKTAPGDGELGETWRRYNLVRSVLQHEEVAAVSSDATQRLFAALEAEEAYAPETSAPVANPVRSLWQGMGRMAIAASVAMAAYVVLQSTLLEPVGTPGSMASSEAPEQAPAVQLADSVDVPVQFDAQAQQRLNDYIRSASIQFSDQDSDRPQFNILEDSQLIRQVNQIEP